MNKFIEKYKRIRGGTYKQSISIFMIVMLIFQTMVFSFSSNANENEPINSGKQFSDVTSGGSIDFKENSNLAGEGLKLDVTPENTTPGAVQLNMQMSPMLIGSELVADTQNIFSKVLATDTLNNLKNSGFINVGSQESISSLSGDLTRNETDLILKGRNGLNLEIGRVFQSQQAMFGEVFLGSSPRISSPTFKPHTEFTRSTYLNDRDHLGLGWMFKFPSVQFVDDNQTIAAKYYHTGTGRVYKVNMTAATDDANLENFYAKNAKFDKDVSYSDGTQISEYSFEDGEKRKQYFAADGRLLAIVDRFGNKISFAYQNVLNSNLINNPDFAFGDNGWNNVRNPDPSAYDFAYFKNIGDSAMTFRTDQSSRLSWYVASDYFAVEPNTTYQVDLDAIDSLNKQDEWGNPMNSSIGVELVLRDNGLNNLSYPRQSISISTGHKTLQFTTHPDQKYGTLLLSVYNGRGEVKFKNISVRKVQPVMSSITDSVGRTVAFEYLGDEYSGQNSQVKVTVSSKDMSQSKQIIYNKGRIIQEYSGLLPIDTVNENRRYENVYRENRYYSTLNDVNYGPKIVKYNYEKKDDLYYQISQFTTEGKHQKQLALTSVENPNSMTVYNYEKTKKRYQFLGINDLYRVKDRVDFLKRSDGQYMTEKTNHIAYSYYATEGEKRADNEASPVLFDENGALYLDPEKQITYCVQTRDDGTLQTTTTQKGNIWQSINKKFDGETTTVSYEAYHDVFKDSPIDVRTIIKNATGVEASTRVKYTYNEWGGLQSETRPLTDAQFMDSNAVTQNTMSYEYDPRNKFLTKKIMYQAPGKLLTLQMSYDDQNRISSTTDEKGIITTYEYGLMNNLGLCTKTTSGVGTAKPLVSEISYDSVFSAFPSENYVWYTDGTGYTKKKISQISYHSLWGQPISVTDDYGNTTEMTYDPLGRIASKTSPQLLESGAPYRIVENFEYSDSITEAVSGMMLQSLHTWKTKVSNGQSVTVFDDTRQYYDDYGNLVRAVVKNGDSEIADSYDYNDYNQLSVHTQPNGAKTSYNFDGWDRLLSVTDSLGNVSKLEYDLINRTKRSYMIPSGTTIPENDILETYDQWGRTVSKKGFPEGYAGTNVAEVRYEYDLIGNLTKTIDPKNAATTFAYDSKNQLTQVIDATNNKTDYIYTPLGQLEKNIQYEGVTPLSRTLTYDERGKITSKTEADGKVYLYESDLLGRTVKVTHPAGQVESSSYDPLGRLLATTMTKAGSSQSSQSIEYTPQGNIKKISGDTAQESQTFEYSPIGLMTSKTYGDGKKVAFDYDPQGKLIGMTDPQGMAYSFGYDVLNRMTTLVADGKGFDYVYYGDGQIKQVTYPAFSNGKRMICSFTYDNLNQVKTIVYQVNGDTLAAYSYTYDKVGNIISNTDKDGNVKTYQYTALDQVSQSKLGSFAATNYVYDSRGNRTQKTGPVLAPVEEAGQKTFSWNLWDQLTKVTQNGVELASFANGVGGERLAKTSAKGTVKYYCDNVGRVLLETDWVGNAKAQNVWGNGILARKTADSKWWYYITDAHGDVRQILKEDGTLANSYEYDEWGNLINAQETIENPIRYAGEYFDDETGLYYLRARYYDPSVGRFISRDTYEGQLTNPMSLNLYTYCENDPVNLVDPTGNKPNTVSRDDSGTVNKKVKIKPEQSIKTSFKIKGNPLREYNEVSRVSTFSLIIGLVAVKVTIDDCNLTGKQGSVNLNKIDFSKNTLKNGLDDIFKSGQKALDNFDIDSAYVKPKHLSTSGGNGAKFLGDSKDAAEEILQNAMKNGTVKSINDNGLTKLGQQSYEIIIDAGQKVGTKGEKLIKIVISDDGGMLSAYPVK